MSEAVTHSHPVDVQRVKDLLHDQADVNYLDPYGETALFECVRTDTATDDDLAVVQILLDAGTDVFYPNASFETAVDVTMEKKNRAGAQVLLEHLRKAGTLEEFVAWEELLAKVRAVNDCALSYGDTAGVNRTKLEQAIAKSQQNLVPLKDLIARLPQG